MPQAKSDSQNRVGAAADTNRMFARNRKQIRVQFFDDGRQQKRRSRSRPRCALKLFAQWSVLSVNRERERSLEKLKNEIENLPSCQRSSSDFSVQPFSFLLFEEVAPGCRRRRMRRHVFGYDAAGATMAFSFTVIPPNKVAPEPIEAPRLIRVRCNASASDCSFRWVGCSR